MSERKQTFHEACASVSEEWQALLARTVIPALTRGASLLLKAAEAVSGSQRGRER